MLLSRKKKKVLTKTLSVILATTVLVTAFPVNISASDSDGNTGNHFKTVPAGDPYEGLPLFDGNPDHVDQYLDAYMDYIGIDGMLRYAMDQRGDYQLRNSATYSSSYADTTKRGKTVSWDNPNAGKRMPGAAQFTDAVQGISTDFPSQVGMGQTWNKELIYELGTVMGNEKLNTIQYNTSSGSGAATNHYLSTVNIMDSAALTDIRTNPLSGRIDEGFAEDPYLAGVLASTSAQGISGNTLPESEDFWQKAFVDTKHFSNYAAQWWRREGSNYSSARGLAEYQARSTYKGFSEGAFSAMMTSYGRTNGVPNAISPMINYVQNISKYPIYTLNDNGAENRFEVAGAFGNGYERKYAPYRVDQMIWQMLAGASGGHQQNTSYPGINDNHIALIEAVQSGKYGIKAEDFEEIAKAQVLVLVRNGVLNERDENNLPKNYPFSSKLWQNTGASSPGQTYNYKNQDSQDTALKSAQESIVLLKNSGNVLPLSKDANFIVAGGLADNRYKTTYSGSTPAEKGMGLSPLGGIASAIGKNVSELDYVSAGKKIAIKANNGKYLSINSSGNVTATSESFKSDSTAQFEVFSWGQADSASLRVVNNEVTAQNGKWLNNGTNVTTANSGNFEVSKMTSGFASAAGPVGVVRREYNNDGRVRYVSNAFSTSFFPSFETLYYGSGRYMSLTNPTTGALGQTAELGSNRSAASFADSAEMFRTEDTLFTEETIKQAGEEVSQNYEYAIVVVGASARHSAGEGSDRIDLDLGREQYELVKNVSAKFPGKTVVVLKSSAPVLMEEIQSNPDVAAILYQPYAGQYDGLSLGQAIFGDYAPTGRMTHTWYADMSALPAATKDMVAEGVERNVASTGNRVMTIQDMDPAFKIDLTNSDPIDTKLTYMYTDAKVTYPFGYGLGYSDFKYSNLQVPGNIQVEKGVFHVTVDITNIGSMETSEVVQLYASALDSPYGNYAPKQQLISFEKITLAPGEKKEVVLEVDPQDLAVWNTNKSKLSVLSGNYSLSAGKSSVDAQLTAKVNVVGETLGTLDASSQPIDVFANSFASSDVTYREKSRQGTMDALKSNNVTEGYYAVMAQEEGAWSAIKNVNLTGAKQFNLSAAAQKEGGEIEIRMDSHDGPLLAVASVPVTESVNYQLSDSDVGVTELGYVNVNADLLDEVSGVKDLYLVFKALDLRVSTLSVDSEPSNGTEASALLSGPSQIKAGSTLNVKYGLANLKDHQVLAEDITISYDAEELDFVSIQSLDESKYLIVGKDPEQAKETKGEIRFLAVRFAEAQSDPNGEIVNLEFKTKKKTQSGIANVMISKAIIAGEEGKETEIEGASYSVQIDVIDRSTLANLISESEAVYSAAVEGTKIGQYPVGSKQALRNAINEAQATYDNLNATEEELQQAVVSLNASLQAFKDSVITSTGGDNNGDDQVTVGDLAIVAKFYGVNASDDLWNTARAYDYNKDGRIDIEDLVWLALKIIKK